MVVVQLFKKDMQKYRFLLIPILKQLDQKIDA